MTAATTIEWTDKTRNPVRGCSVISPGCVNCYAMKQAHRFSGAGEPFAGLTKQTKAGPQSTGVVRTVEDALLEPLSCRKPQRVFVNSMSDLFHDDVPDAFIDKVFAVMALAPRHTFQVLTKRADRRATTSLSRSGSASVGKAAWPPSRTRWERCSMAARSERTSDRSTRLTAR
jgi:protein gp37